MLYLYFKKYLKFVLKFHMVKSPSSHPFPFLLTFTGTHTHTHTHSLIKENTNQPVKNSI